MILASNGITLLGNGVLELEIRSLPLKLIGSISDLEKFIMTTNFSALVSRVNPNRSSCSNVMGIYCPRLIASDFLRKSRSALYRS